MAPPSRIKLHQRTGKLRAIKANSDPTTVSNLPSEQAIDTYDVRQFELELCWCIQTLETSLNSEQLNAKQAQDALKTIQLLKSSTQPMIKKRQIMRQAFGDYRKKMADEEKKLRLRQRQFHFKDNVSETNPRKSYFVKKSVVATLGQRNGFKFNFSIEDKLDQMNLAAKQILAVNRDTNLVGEYAKFTPVGNTFKFEFNVMEEDGIIKNNL